MATVFDTLVQPDILQKHLRDRDWILFDCRHSLRDKAYGQRVYREGHLPGARFADVDHDLSSAITPETGRHPLPDPQAFMTWLASRGVNTESQVVAYDDNQGAFASRLWWMLRYLGHARVAVLDGGIARWKLEGRQVTPDIPQPTRGNFKGTPQPGLVAPLEEVERLSAAQQGLLVDARAGERYRGETEPIDRVPGHIPSAVNLPYAANLGPDNRFLPAEELRKRFDAALNGSPAEASIHYCGSGVTACHNLLAMAAAGLPMGRLYPGSWSQWSKDPARPVATGAMP